MLLRRTVRVTCLLGVLAGAIAPAPAGLPVQPSADQWVGTWAAAQAFGLEIPFWVMVSHVPIILIVSSLPVNVAGFGAVQGVWLLLTPWASAERILAFSVIWQLVSCLALIVRGTPFVRGALADIRLGRDAAAGRP
jgi:hypothetical protein